MSHFLYPEQKPAPSVTVSDSTRYVEVTDGFSGYSEYPGYPGHYDQSTPTYTTPEPKEHPNADPWLTGTIHVPWGWPTEPTTTRESGWAIATDLTLDVFLLLLSLAFLAFGLVVRAYDHAPTESHPQLTDALVQAAKYGPTVFPLLFAAVLGRASHAIFVWFLERGARVGTLDLLAGCSSLTSVVTSQYQMRMVSFLGVLLMLIWALSPVGGQASIRQLSLATRLATEETNYTYMIPGTSMMDYRISDHASAFANINALLMSSLMSPMSTKESALDTWGNVKIPLIEMYEQAGEPDDDGWYTADASNNTYSSLIGIPISGFSSSGGAFARHAVSIEARYLYLDCPVVYGDWVEPEDIPEEQSYYGTDAYIWWRDNDTARTATPPGEQTERRSFFYQWWLSPTNMTSHCYLSTTYVEADVRCGGAAGAASCAAARLRRSRQPGHPPAAYTLLDQPWGVFGLVAENYVNAMAGHSAFPTAVEYYLVSPADPFAGWPSPDPAAADRPSRATYAARLGQLLNAYWTAMNAMHAVAGGLTPDTAFLPGDARGLLDTDVAFLANTSSSRGTRSRDVEVLAAHRPWVAALCVASVVLVLASLVRPVVRNVCGGGAAAPDLMCNVSSLALRDNPYAALPPGGSALGAAQRARLLRDVVVRLGDVRPGEEIGRIAVASLRPGNVADVGGVSKSRLYE
ncbi:hypothetical protein F4780DRAFT_786586 [Xylariomycetidae sp. FL0641]|nr:hypothetical protein F4780DRAFT_786586 [Xylariomycetidae sp. FL0641]